MAKIVVANKFYYPKGGDCTATLALEQLLQQKGHDTAIFSMQHPENRPTPWNQYFPSEVKFSKGVGFYKMLMRPFGTREVIQNFNRLLRDFNPDIVHLNNIHSQLSPIIGELSKQKGCKVVWTLHDYKLLCPRYDCLRNGNTICEACFTDKRNVLTYKCMKNSRIASYIAYKEATVWNRERLEACTDAFICPSQFMANKMAEGGFNRHKLHTICNFIDMNKCLKETYEKEDYYCFIGRLSHEKGIATLLQAANQLPYKLIIIGNGPLEKTMKEIAAPHIDFVGFKQWDDIKKIVGKAKFNVIPSEWYENNPYSVIESLCLGTPVLGAQIGGIPELIVENVTGTYFQSKNGQDLKEKIELMYNKIFNYKQIAQESILRFNSESYYKRLIELYNNL